MQLQQLEHPGSLLPLLPLPCTQLLPHERNKIAAAHEGLQHLVGNLHATAYLVHHSCVFLLRWIFFCSCRMPYSRPSAVGGQPGT